MKKLLFLTLLGIVSLTASAQMRRPVFRPDWVFEAPRPSNGTYLYVVEHGEGKTKREALNQAIGRVFQSTANRIGQYVSTDEINRAIQAGTDYEVIARNMNVPVNKVCEFPVQDTLTNSWTMYILCQVAKAGNIPVEFEATDECTKHTRFEAALKKWKEQEKAKEKEKEDALKKENGIALATSIFIPGVGQMYKGNYIEGSLTLVGEGVLIGGGVTMLVLSRQQKKIMNDASGTLSYNDYSTAKKNHKAFLYTSYGFFGAAAVLYGVNLWRAWACPNKRNNQQYSFYPTLIPEQNNNLALGLGMTMNF